MLNRTGIGMKKYPVKEVIFLTKWNGYDVYDFCLDVDENEIIQIGTLRFYLVKGDEVIVTTPEQALDIVGKIHREEELKEWDENYASEPVPS